MTDWGRIQQLFSLQHPLGNPSNSMFLVCPCFQSCNGQIQIDTCHVQNDSVKKQCEDDEGQRQPLGGKGAKAI